MIYDKLENLYKYKSLNPYLEKVIDFIENNSLSKLDIGKTNIDGENVFVNVIETNTNYRNDVSYEVHNKYIDLHINIYSGEKFYLGYNNSSIEINNETDIGFCECQCQLEGLLNKNYFVLFFSGEAHIPTLNISKMNMPTKKVIFKILDIKKK